MRRAFNALKNGRSGPVMVEVPADVTGIEVEVDPSTHRPVRAHPLGRRRARHRRCGEKAGRRQPPMIIAGQGVLYAEASDELLQLAELLQAPVMTTTDGKSAFPEDHALALGSGGGTYTGHGRHFLHRAT